MEEIVTINPDEIKEDIGTSSEVKIEAEVIDALIEETKNRGLSNMGEFQAFLLGKSGIAELGIHVGISSDERVILNIDEVAMALKPYIEQGYQIVADYHNHPEASVAQYIAAGLPVAFATSPSIGDIDLEFTKGVQSNLGQAPYSRIIGVYDTSKDQVLLNAFEVVRQYETDEAEGLEFEEPVSVVDQSTDIVLGKARYTLPNKLISAGLIKPVNIVRVGQDETHQQILNPLISK